MSDETTSSAFKNGGNHFERSSLKDSESSSLKDDSFNALQKSLERSEKLSRSTIVLIARDEDTDRDTKESKVVHDSAESSRMFYNKQQKETHQLGSSRPTSSPSEEEAGDDAAGAYGVGALKGKGLEWGLALPPHVPSSPIAALKGKFRARVSNNAPDAGDWPSDDWDSS